SEGTLSRTLDRINTGEALNVPGDEAGLSRASSLVASHLNQTITQFNLKFNQFAHNLDNRLFRLGQLYVKADPALQAAANPGTGTCRSAEATCNTMLNNELQAEGNGLNGAISSVQGTIAGSSATGVAARTARFQPLSVGLPSFGAANQAAFSSFAGQLNNNFN